MGEIRNVYNILVVKPVRNRLSGDLVTDKRII
jgi:hypothetical protein